MIPGLASGKLVQRRRSVRRHFPMIGSRVTIRNSKLLGLLGVALGERFAKPLYEPKLVPGVRIPPSPPEPYNPNYLVRILTLLNRGFRVYFIAF